MDVYYIIIYGYINCNNSNENIKYKLDWKA